MPRFRGRMRRRFRRSGGRVRFKRRGRAGGKRRFARGRARRQKIGWRM